MRRDPRRSVNTLLQFRSDPSASALIDCGAGLFQIAGERAISALAWASFLRRHGGSPGLEGSRITTARNSLRREGRVTGDIMMG